jgi:alanyl-tRNA synthetase
MFKILSESSVASGTRRIEAVCGFSAIEQFIETRQRVTELSQMLSTPPDQLTDRVRKMKDEIKELQKELKDARQSTTGNLLSDLEDQKESIQGLQVLVQNVEQAHPDNLRALVDDLVNNRGLDVVLLGTTNDDSVTFALRVSDAAQAQDVTADEFIRIPAEHVGGGGGGRDDFAQAGGPNTEQVGDALDVFSNKLKQRL